MKPILHTRPSDQEIFVEQRLLLQNHDETILGEISPTKTYLIVSRYSVAKNRLTYEIQKNNNIFATCEIPDQLFLNK